MIYDFVHRFARNLYRRNAVKSAGFGMDDGFGNYPKQHWQVYIPDQSHPILRERIYLILAESEQDAKDAVLFCLNHGVRLPHTWGEVDEVMWPKFATSAYITGRPITHTALVPWLYESFSYKDISKVVPLAKPD